MTIDFDDFVELAKKGRVSKYTLEDIYGQMIASDISEETGASVSYDNYDFIFNANKQRLSKRDMETYDDVLDWVESQIGNVGDVYTTKVINHYKYVLFNGFYLGEKMGEFKYTSQYGLAMGDLCDVLSYVVGDVDFEHNGHHFEDDAKEYAKKHPDEETPIYVSGYSWVTNYGIWFDMGKTINPMFNGLSVKFFKNGKIQVKGLTAKEWNKLVDLNNLIKNNKYYL